ncbi:S1 RNA-binding domain-containing protein [Candidatus Peregrinibacteria bacterium]|nr:S1 RNA-binding domain-containing protein [Candidatus Peregrinibacteria bacterium]
MFKIIDSNLTMEDLLKESSPLIKPPLGAVIEGTIISKAKNQIIVDLNGIAVGLISGRESHDSLGTSRDLKEGDIVKAVVVERENADGMVVLSLRRASQANTWDRFEKAFKDGEVIEVMVNEANKGGLLLDLDGIKGFIPVSQLAPAHYPRVDDANANEIYNRLQKLIGQRFKVKVISIDREVGKMILSERAAQHVMSKKILSKLHVGDVVDGQISGVVKFGIFVTFEGLEGLVHISEIAWGHVSNPHQYGKVGDTVKIQIIGIEGDKLSLSMKRLTPDPWEDIAKRYTIGSRVKGTIDRFSQFGAFVKLGDGLNGLIHLSEISADKVEDPRDYVTIGDVVEAEVINIDREEHRIGLSIKELKLSKKAKAEAVSGEKVPKEEKEIKETPKKAKKAKEAAEEKSEKNEDSKKEKAPKKTVKKTVAKKAEKAAE